MGQMWVCQSSQLIKEFRVIIFLQLNKLMITEYEQLGPLFKTLNFLTCRSLGVSIVRYFTHEQIKAICQAFEKYKTPHFFVQLVRTLNFVNGYLNSMDKSLYFAFYDKEQYKKMEIQHIASISLQNSNSFLKYEQQFKTIIACICQKVAPIQPELQTLKEVLINPDLPLPRLKRETQGIFCSSPFQLFLVCSTFSDDSEEQFFTCFEQFKDFLSLQKEEEYLKQFITILKDKHSNSADLKKIKQVRYTPYEITAGTMQDYFLQGNELHNFIVGLFALTDVMVKATHDYIQQIADPLHRLVELTLRYNIYRNYVLAIEEYLPFVFRMYENIYKETIDDGVSKPIYKFWRPALSKWYLQMNQLHKESEQVYMYCLTKLQNIKLKSEIEQLFGEDQLRYSKLMNAVQQSRFQYELGMKTFNGYVGNSSQMSLFFDSSPQNYQMVVIQFNEYLIDISVNEQTVHWCGHTDHQLQQPYLDYECNLTAMLQQFYQSVTHKQITREQISSIAKINVQYLSTLQIKNRTLKKVMDFINTRYQLLQELEILGDFQEADKKLQYFNHKALILAVVDENARPFYSIPPHYSPQKLIDMIDTNDSSNNSDPEPIEYLSESQNKEGESERSSKHNKNSFAQQDSQNEDMDQNKLEKRVLSKKQPRPSKKFLEEQQEEEESNVVNKQYQIYHSKS